MPRSWRPQPNDLWTRLDDLDLVVVLVLAFDLDNRYEDEEEDEDERMLTQFWLRPGHIFCWTFHSGYDVILSFAGYYQVSLSRPPNRSPRSPP